MANKKKESREQSIVSTGLWAVVLVCLWAESFLRPHKLALIVGFPLLIVLLIYFLTEKK